MIIVPINWPIGMEFKWIAGDNDGEFFVYAEKPKWDSWHGMWTVRRPCQKELVCHIEPKPFNEKFGYSIRRIK